MRTTQAWTSGSLQSSCGGLMRSHTHGREITNHEKHKEINREVL